MSHPGNIRFQVIIDRHRDAYQQAAKRDDKAAVASRVLDEIQSCAIPAEGKEDEYATNLHPPIDSIESVRFLLKSPEQGDNHWTVVDHGYIKEKIAHALRSRPKATRKRRAQEMEEKRALGSNLEQDAASGIEADVQSMLHEQQALLKKLISEQVFLDQGTATAPPDGVVGSDNSNSPTAVLKTAESLNLKWRTCPMEKGLHICHHLG